MYDATDRQMMLEILLRVTQMQRIIERQYIPPASVLGRGASDWPATPMPTMEDMVSLAHDPSGYTPPTMNDLPPHP